MNRWNDGMELAFILNRSIDLASSPDLSAISSITRADKLDEDMDQIALSKRRPSLGRPLPRRDLSSFTPEPYLSLANAVSDFTHNIILRRTEKQEVVAERSRTLQEKFHKAIGNLIGRDVYVQGMNPYEVKEAA